MAVTLAFRHGISLDDALLIIYNPWDDGVGIIFIYRLDGNLFIIHRLCTQTKTASDYRTTAELKRHKLPKTTR